MLSRVKSIKTRDGYLSYTASSLTTALYRVRFAPIHSLFKKLFNCSFHLLLPFFILFFSSCNFKKINISLLDKSPFFESSPNTYPLIMTFRTSGPSEMITLPSRSGYSYNYTVDWGDGSALESFSTDANQTHIYDNPGDYVVKINGQFSAIYFAGLFTEGPSEGEKLIAVNDLGRTQLTSLAGAFVYCLNLENFNVGFGDTSNVTDMSDMFSYTSLTSLDLSNLDTSNVTNMSGMFFSTSLTSLDLSNLDTSNVTNMSGMFSNTSLTSLNLSNLDTSNVTNMSGMFSYTSLTSLNLSNLDTSNVTDMSSMFNGAASLTSLDLSSLDTSNVTNMSGMFSNTSFTSLNLSNLDTSNVTDMSDMFFGTSIFTSVDLSNFNTSNVKNMSGMFAGTDLTTFDLSNLDTSNVRDMSRMFNLTDLTSVDLSNLDTSNVTDMSSMFNGAASLTTINLSNLDTSNVTDMSGMFANTYIASLNLSNLDTSNVTNMDGMFGSAHLLTSLNLSGWTLRNPLPTSFGIFSNTPVGKIVYCSQNPIGDTFSITCTP